MILSRGRVSAQGHQIFDSGLMELLQQGFDFQACVGNTGQMGHRLNAQIVLDVEASSWVFSRVEPPAP